MTERQLHLLPCAESAQFKELGFDWPCTNFYMPSYAESRVLLNWHKKRNSERSDGQVNAPTLDLACKWLRDVHGLFIMYIVKSNSTFVPKVVNMKSGNEHCGFFTDKSGLPYEEAQLQGIKEAIDWLQKEALQNEKFNQQ